MFIYIEIINLFYSYVLFCAIAIKTSSEHDLLCYACLWQMLWHSKTMMLMSSLFQPNRWASSRTGNANWTLHGNTVKSITYNNLLYFNIDYDNTTVHFIWQSCVWHLNSVSSLSYSVVAAALSAYVISSEVMRFIQYMQLPWPEGEFPRTELNIHIGGYRNNTLN